MKTKIILLLQLAALSVCADVYWNQYPFGIPGPTDTFLFATATTNKQITGADMLNWTGTNIIAGLTNLQTGKLPRYGYDYFEEAGPTQWTIQANGNNMPIFGGVTFQGVIVAANTNVALCTIEVPTTMFIAKTNLVTDLTFITTNYPLGAYFSIKNDGIRNYYATNNMLVRDDQTLINGTTWVSVLPGSGTNIFDVWFTNRIYVNSNIVTSYWWPTTSNAVTVLLNKAQFWSY